MASTDDKRRKFLLKLLLVHHLQTILVAAVHCHAQSEINQCRLFKKRKGDSVSELGDSDDDSLVPTSGARKRERANEAESTTATIMKGILDQRVSLMHHLEAREKLNKEQFEASDKFNKKVAAFYIRLEAAKSLGDRDELQKLMVEAKSWVEE
jgi:hypothetical protein